MKLEFGLNYDQFFIGAIEELEKTIAIKLDAIESCNQALNEQINN